MRVEQHKVNEDKSVLHRIPGEGTADSSCDVFDNTIRIKHAGPGEEQLAGPATDLRAVSCLASAAQGSLNGVPSFRVQARASTNGAAEFGQKRTVPSANSMLAPPVWLELSGTLDPVLSVVPLLFDAKPIALIG